MSVSSENQNNFKRIFRPWDSDYASSTSTSSSASTISDDEVLNLKVFRPWENRPKSSMSSSSSLSNFSDEISPIQCEMQIEHVASFSPHKIDMMNINYQYNPAYLEPNTITLENNIYPEIYNKQIEEATYTAMEQYYDSLKNINDKKNDSILLDQYYNNSLQMILKKRRFEEITNEGATKSKKRPLKKYKCDICEIAFLSKSQLKIHFRAHTGERPYRCSEENCSKQFMRKEELTRHERIHTGVKPYSCDECGKCFGRTDHLKTHLKTHTKLKSTRGNEMKTEFNDDKQIIPINPMFMQFASHFNGF